MLISNSYIRELFDEYGIEATDDTQFLEKQLNTFGEGFILSLGLTYYVTSLPVHTGE